jgi:hypothetical protein
MSTISGKALTQCGLSLATPEAFLRSYRLQRIAIDQVPTRTSQCGLLRSFDWRRSVGDVCFGSKADISVMSKPCPLYPGGATDWLRA